MLNPNVIQLRGTLFLPVIIGYSSANSEKYKLLLDGALVQPVSFPVPNGLQYTQEAALQENGPWQLVRGNTRIIFFQNKIDIIQDIILPKDTFETEFCSFCAEIFSRILEIANTTSTRLAFAPIYAKDPDATFNSTVFWNAVLKHATFDGSNIEEVNITCNRKVEKSINDNLYTINFRSVLSDATRTLAGLVFGGSVMISFDINTAILPEKTFQFDSDDIKSFFANVVLWSNEFFNNTLSEI